MNLKKASKYVPKAVFVLKGFLARPQSALALQTGDFPILGLLGVIRLLKIVLAYWLGSLTTRITVYAAGFRQLASSSDRQ